MRIVRVVTDKLSLVALGVVMSEGMITVLNQITSSASSLLRTGITIHNLAAILLLIGAVVLSLGAIRGAQVLINGFRADGQMKALKELLAFVESVQARKQQATTESSDPQAV